MRQRFLVLLIATVVTWRAGASCMPEELPEKCLAREWAEKEVSQANTGVGNLVSPSQSTSKDFLSMLAAAVLVPMGGNGSRPIAIDYNRPIKLFGEQRIKLEAVLARPELSGLMKQRLAGKTAALTELKDSLSELDDVTLNAALEPSTVGLGRSITPHLDSYMAMLKAHMGNATISEMGMQAREFAGPFAMLLNNQPQLFGSVLYRARRNVAGADERSVRLTYEKGFRSLNDFYKGSNNLCRELKKESREDDKSDCAKKLVAFVKDGSSTGTNPSADDPADRLALSVEYRMSDPFTVDLTQYSVNFNASKAHMFVYSVGYGRNGMMNKHGRFDLTLNYEDSTVSKISDLATVPDATKAVRDRLVVSATFTYKMNGAMAMPFTLTYANHASFLGDVGRRLNAHFGITFKMPR